jgi:putative ABC transport system permease protein
MVKGVEPDYSALLDYKIRDGRVLLRRDLDTFAKVALIGSKIADDFFRTDPVGKTIYLSGMPFRVIGVMDKRGSFSNENFDEAILIPLTTHMKVLENVDYLDGAVILAVDREAIRDTIRQIVQLLTERHGKKDFTVSTYQELQSTTSKTLHLFSVLSRVVASIAFSVGTLGILAIMALSIYERILEIAIKRVTGARKSDIFLQFLTESMVLSLTGSAAGIVISIILALTVQFLAKWSFFLPWKTAGISILLSVSIGIISGIYPALKALEFEPKAILGIFDEG